VYATGRPRLPPFAAPRAFDMVGRRGGIRKAAETLGVSHAIVSRHLSSLESLLGAPLMNRQSGELTALGHAYHARITAAISEMEAATHAIRSEKTTNLVIWCSAGFALHWLTGRLCEFSRGRDRLVIDLRSTESEPIFDRNEADGDLRYYFDWAPPPTSRNVRFEEVVRPNVFAVATPELLARHGGHPTTLQAIKAMPLLQEGSDVEWASWLRAQGDEGGDVPSPVARYGQAHLTLAASLAGHGVALSNQFLAAESLRAGRLVRVDTRLPTLRSVTLGSYVFRCGRGCWSDPMLVSFRGWLRNTIARETGDHERYLCADS
jgi:LysR family glycine cleavage system transcriptional activator